MFRGREICSPLLNQLNSQDRFFDIEGSFPVMCNSSRFVALFACLPPSQPDDSVHSPAVSQHFHADDAQYEPSSHELSDIKELSQEATPTPAPYLFGPTTPTEVYYYCCHCNHGPFSWNRTPHCQNCHRMQCEQCRKKVLPVKENPGQCKVSGRKTQTPVWTC